VSSSPPAHLATAAVGPRPGLRWRWPSIRLSPAAAYAVRFAVAAPAAIWLGKAPGLVENHSSWILITVLVLMQPTAGATLLKGLLRIAGTVAAALTAILLFGLFAQDPPLLAAAFFVVQAVGAYGNAGARFPYAWFVWSFTTGIILIDALAGQGAVETVAFQRASMVGLGILLVALADLLLFRVRAEPRLRASLAARARALGDALERAVAGPDDQRPAATASDARALSGQLALIDAAHTELATSRGEIDALGRLATLLETLASRARTLAAVPESLRAATPALDSASKDLAGHIRAALDQLADALASPAPRVRFSEDLDRALLAVEAELERLASGRSAALAGWCAGLEDVVALLRRAETTLSTHREAAAATLGERLRRFRVDPLRTRIALRSGVAVLAAVVAPLALGWEPNAIVVPVAFLVSAFNRGGGVQFMAVLTVMLAVGWALADVLLVFVTPHAQTGPIAMVAPLVVTGVLAYLAAAQPKLALGPVIAGQIALLAVFGGSSAPTDVQGPYDTVCFFALAAGLGWGFSRVMWPMTAAATFRQRVAAQLEACRSALRASLESGDAGRGERAARLIHDCTSQSAQLGPLHAQAGLEPVERGLDESLRAAVLPLTADLADAVVGRRSGALSESGSRGEAMRRLPAALERVDEALLESLRCGIDTLRDEAPHHPSRLAAAQADAEDLLRALAADPRALDGVAPEQTRRLLVEIDSQRKLVSRQRAIEDWFEAWQSAERHARDPR
jgi:uncharacterized membrane protein YccC